LDEEITNHLTEIKKQTFDQLLDTKAALQTLKENLKLEESEDSTLQRLFLAVEKEIKIRVIEQCRETDERLKERFKNERI